MSEKASTAFKLSKSFLKLQINQKLKQITSFFTPLLTFKNN